MSGDGVSKNQQVLFGKKEVSPKRWHQIVVTFDNGLMTDYVDGARDSSQRVATKSIFNSHGGKDRRIGADSASFMDELAVYTRALSAQEVARHYRAGKPAVNRPLKEMPIYDGQDQMMMNSSFFKGLFPQTQPSDMQGGEHLRFYDGKLPPDRSSSYWKLYGDQSSGKGWKKFITEKTAYDALLRDIGPDGQKRWEVGISKSGQLYSWRGPWGEAIPPQFMPWTDEVWQATGLAGEIQQMSDKLNKLGSGPIGNGFVQAGVTSCQFSPAYYAFYSPMLARWFDAADNAYYVLNWMQSPGAPTLFKHKLLYYTRYKYLGAGVLEVTTASFNAGKFTYGYNGIPWGGVRASTYPNLYASKPDGSYDDEHMNFGGAGSNVSRKQTDGWMGATASTTDPNAHTFGFVFGTKYDKKLGPGGGAAFGGAGGPKSERDYTVMASNAPGTQKPGQGFWVNYYLMVGPKGQVIQNSKKYAARGDYYGKLNFTEQTTGLTPLYLDSNHLLTRDKQNDSQPVCQVYNLPVTNSQPLLRISEVNGGGKTMITTDPYAMSYKAPWTNVLQKSDPHYKEYNHRDTMLPYLSQDGKILHWTLLDFVMPTNKCTLDRSQYKQVPGITTADGEQPMAARRETSRNFSLFAPVSAEVCGHDGFLYFVKCDALISNNDV